MVVVVGQPRKGSGLLNLCWCGDSRRNPLGRDGGYTRFRRYSWSGRGSTRAEQNYNDNTRNLFPETKYYGDGGREITRFEDNWDRNNSPEKYDIFGNRKFGQ